MASEVKDEIDGEEVGAVAHYYSKISVAVVELKGSLNVGDRIRIVGPETDFEQQVSSMQADHKPVQAAAEGDAVGMKVDGHVKERDKVYKV